VVVVSDDGWKKIAAVDFVKNILVRTGTVPGYYQVAYQHFVVKNVVVMRSGDAAGRKGTPAAEVDVRAVRTLAL
jgi:hypothetical protein